MTPWMLTPMLESPDNRPSSGATQGLSAAAVVLARGAAVKGVAPEASIPPNLNRTRPEEMRRSR